MNTLKKKNVNKQYLIDDYISSISSNCEKKIASLKSNLTKIDNDNLIVPTIKNYTEITNYNYNVQQLKQFAKNYKLKIGGNKKELITRIFTFLYLSSYIIKIQKYVRGFIQRKYNQYHGPAFKNRALCNNSTDFISMEDLKDLPSIQFFSYKDTDGFIYGFDLVSIYNLLFKNKNKNTKEKNLNPYNRNEIPSVVNKNIKSIVRMSKIIGDDINLSIMNDYEVTKTKSVELTALALFQEIDSLGNYTDSNWFLSLNRVQLIKFVMELNDIWSYRAQLSLETKRSICPPNGTPFSNTHIAHLHAETDIIQMQKIVLAICAVFVFTGVNNDSRSLGCYYVLGALCLVNTNAAEALPWLYQSVSFF
jgi:hypothetical protein